MKKLLAATLGLGAFVAFAFQSPSSETAELPLQEELPLVITLEGIEDGTSAQVNTGEFLAETE